MNFQGVAASLARVLLAPRALGVAALGLAAAAGYFSGHELYRAVQAASPQLSGGMVNFWPVVLGLIGLALDVTAAVVGFVGGGLMIITRFVGRRMVVAAVAGGIAGEVVLAFVERGPYNKTTSAIWVGLLVVAYVLLIASAIFQRRR